MFGALEFSDKMAGVGVQPIVGTALALDFGDGEAAPRLNGQAPARQRVVLLAAREEGYRNLMRLSSRAFLDNPSGEPPHVKRAWLEGATDGLIALTGGPGGPLDSTIASGQAGLAGSRLDELLRLFGNRLYVELQRHDAPGARATEG